MNTTAAVAQTDYGVLLKDAFNSFLKSENLVPLLVGALVVTFGSMTIILAPPLILGFVRTSIKIARGEPAKIDDLWSGFQQFGASLILGLVAGVIISIGFVLLFVPGLVATFLFAFAFHVLAVNPNAGVGECLQDSIRIVRANIVDVLVLFVIAGVLTAVLSFTVIGSFAVAGYTALLGAMMFVRMNRSGPSLAK